MRFPGQYYDSESALHYNAQRTYEAPIGRYAQSDPIGLNGGLDTYSYVSSASLDHSDANGTCLDGCVLEGVLVYEGAAAAWGWLAGSSIPGAMMSSHIGKSAQLGEMIRDRQAYNRVCKSPPPRTGDKCKDAKANLDRLRQCLTLREAYRTKWSTWLDRALDDGHDTEMENTAQAIKKLEKFIEDNCRRDCDKP